MAPSVRKMFEAKTSNQNPQLVAGLFKCDRGEGDLKEGGLFVRKQRL